MYFVDGALTMTEKNFTTYFARLLAVVCVLITLLSLHQALAQGAVNLATLVGEVRDQAGSALSNAKVTIKHQGTGLTRETVSGDDGRFIAAQLPSGLYQMSIELMGFKQAVLSNVMLNPVKSPASSRSRSWPVSASRALATRVTTLIAPTYFATMPSWAV
jgi:hypothetical protein